VKVEVLVTCFDELLVRGLLEVVDVDVDVDVGALDVVLVVSLVRVNRVGDLLDDLVDDVVDVLVDLVEDFEVTLVKVLVVEVFDKLVIVELLLEEVVS
jgi:hypothetical protein